MHARTITLRMYMRSTVMGVTPHHTVLRHTAIALASDPVLRTGSTRLKRGSRPERPQELDSAVAQVPGQPMYDTGLLPTRRPFGSAPTRLGFS